MSFFFGQNPLPGSGAVTPEAPKRPWNMPVSSKYFYDPLGPHRSYYFQSGLPSMESTDQIRFVFGTGSTGDFDNILLGLTIGDDEFRVTARYNSFGRFDIDINWFRESITLSSIPRNRKIALYLNAIDEEYGPTRFSAWEIDKATGARLSLLGSRNHTSSSYTLDRGPYLMTYNELDSPGIYGNDAFLSKEDKLYEMSIWDQNSNLKECLVPLRTGNGTVRAALRNTVNGQFQELQGNGGYAILSMGND